MADRRVTVSALIPRRLAIELRASTPTQRRKIVESLRQSLSRVADGLEYDQREKRYTCRYSAHKHLWDWVHATFTADEIDWHAQIPELEAAREREERAAFERERAEWHRQHGTAKPGPATALDEAYRLFHLRPGAPRWVAEAVYRAAAVRYHPDKHGGDETKMRALNTAIERIRRAQKA